MRPESSLKKNIAMAGLTLACLLAGFGFHKASGEDFFISFAFTFGLLGIMMSVGRNLKI